MADNAPASGGAPPRSSVSASIFYAVSAVLMIAVAVVYFVLNSQFTASAEKTAKDLEENKKAASAATTAIESLTVSLKKQSEEADTKLAAAKKELSGEISKLADANKKLEADKEKLSTDLAAARKETETFATSLKGALGKIDAHEKELDKTRSDLTTTTQGLASAERDIKYLKDDLAGKLKKAEEDLKGLVSANSNELKKEHAALVQEVANVTKGGKATKEQLEKLQMKTTRFELRVMAERIRQATAALQVGDHKRVLELLDFVE